MCSAFARVGSEPYNCGSGRSAESPRFGRSYLPELVIQTTLTERSVCGNPTFMGLLPWLFVAAVAQPATKPPPGIHPCFVTFSSEPLEQVSFGIGGGNQPVAFIRTCFCDIGPSCSGQ